MEKFKKIWGDRVIVYRIEKWFWTANIPAVAGVYFLAPKLWDKLSILYLAGVSIYALVSQAAAKERTAEVAAEQKNNSG